MIEQGKKHTRSEVHALYETEVAAIRATNEHPQAVTMALNEARRWLDRELDSALPDPPAPPTLGQRLRENQARIQREKREREEQIRLAEERRQSEHRRRCVSWFDGWKVRVAGSIARGEIPDAARMPALVVGKTWQSNGIGAPGHENHWLWHEFMLPWAQHEGLEIVVSHEHDGMGVESWWSITVRPA